MVFLARSRGRPYSTSSKPFWTTVHGCYSLNQLQCLLRVGGQAESVVERLLLQLDEQGLGLSSPWQQRKGALIAEAVWPKVWATWQEKTEMDWVL